MYRSKIGLVSLKKVRNQLGGIFDFVSKVRDEDDELKDKGEILEEIISIAVDKNVIPYGSKVLINGQEHIAHDCGGAIKNNRIDVYMASHEEALEFGVQYAEVFLMKEGENNG